MSQYSADGAGLAARHPRPPADVLAWAQRASHLVQAVVGADLTAVYLHGSAVLGGWSRRSDVDLLLVVADCANAGTVTAAGQALAAAARDCPGTGLESSLVTAAAAAVPAPPWPFLLHVVANQGEPNGRRIMTGQGRGDPDLLMHYAVCREAGQALLGPRPAAVIGPVARPVILDYLAGELRWGLEHAAESYAVLNACRALVYARDGAIVSKLAGGAAGLRSGLGPSDVIRRAIDQQHGRAPARKPGADAAAFVRSAAARVAAAASVAER